MKCLLQEPNVHVLRSEMSVLVIIRNIRTSRENKSVPGRLCLVVLVLWSSIPVMLQTGGCS